MRFQTSAVVKLSLEHAVLDIGATSSFDMLPGLVQGNPRPTASVVPRAGWLKTAARFSQVAEVLAMQSSSSASPSAASASSGSPSERTLSEDPASLVSSSPHAPSSSPPPSRPSASSRLVSPIGAGRGGSGGQLHQPKRSVFHVKQLAGGRCECACRGGEL